MNLRVGIDIGSTTVKVVVLDEENKLLFRSYERHYSKTRERALETLRMTGDLLRGQEVRLAITGSAGLGVAKAAGLDFVQEVYATAAAVRTYIPDTDAVIELGGEDAKIIFFGGALEERMNGSCAGGTGAWKLCSWTATTPCSPRTATVSPPWARPCAPPTTPPIPLRTC